jgi:transcriptional regulator with XRE-family HTH domain
MFVYIRESPVSSISYKIGQKVESCRLMQGYTQAELASKVGLTCQEINNYELGYVLIPIKTSYAIAEELSVSVADLLPEAVEVRKDNYCEDEDEEILYLIGIYERIQDQELRKAIRPLIRSVYVSEKMSQEEAKIEVARNLIKEGVSVDIIAQATGLSTYEYADTEKEICTNSIYYKIGQRIKEWRLIRRYTQKDLEDKVSLTLKEIHDYEKGYTDVPLDKLYEIAEVLSVNIKALLPKVIKEENKLLSFINEYRKTEDQESRDILDTLGKFLFEDMQTGKEKIKKAEKIMVAKNLVEAGIAVDIILRTTGLTADELDAS